jgi:predicted permease
MSFKRWFGRGDADYQEEIREHLAMETQANIDRGMSPEDAARAARLSFGSVEGTRQQLHEGGRTFLMNSLAEDFRYAFRTIRRNWLLSCAVVATLSVGIGVTAAVFSVVNGLAFNPPVNVQPDSFVRILNTTRTPRRVASVPKYERLRTRVRSIRELAAWSGFLPLEAALGSDESVASAGGLMVSCNFFSVFNDDPPRLGRFFLEEDCAKATPVIILNQQTWRNRFDSDPDIIGRSIAFGGHPLTVIGVAVSPKLFDDAAPDGWFPYTLQPYLKDTGTFLKVDWMNDEKFEWLQMAGRLQPGYSREAALAELRVVDSPDLRITDGSVWSIYPTQVMLVFALTLVFPTVVMLIVCATVATLLLSRAIGRRHEMAIRLSLGGSRRRLVQTLLAENFLLAGTAGAISLLFAYLVPPFLLEFVSVRNVPPLVASLDWRVFTYIGFISVIAAVFSGLSPALESLNTHLGESLKGRELISGPRSGSRVRSILIGVQIAFSMVLLVMAGALLRGERRLTDPGFETRQVLFAMLGRVDGSTTETALAQGIRSIPGVRSVAFSKSLPLVRENGIYLDLPGSPAQGILSADVSEEYFSTLGIPVLSGRVFSRADTDATSDEPVVISQQLARRAFPQENPVGKFLQMPMEKRRVHIIGVVKDRDTGTGPIKASNDGSFVYKRVKPSEFECVLVRFDGDARPLTRALQSFLKLRTGAFVPVATLQSSLEMDAALLRRIQILLTLLGGIGLSLALIGVFGVVSFTATRRKRDFAIRAALGASRGSIFGAIMKAGMRPVPVALFAGAVLSFAALQFIAAQRILPMSQMWRDPIPYLAAGGILLVAVLTALAFPAFRAMSSDPVHALREE